MKVYVDSSVVLRIILREPKPLREWARITKAFTSEIARVECLRTLDRLRVMGAMNDRELARRRATAIALLTGFDQVRVNKAVLGRAAEPFPIIIRTLDAVHVASALLVSVIEPSVRVATHDTELADAAKSVGLHVIGV